MTKKKIALSSLVFVLVGYGIGRYAQPASIVEVEKIVTKDQVKTETIVKEITKPDGTKIKVITDKKEVKKEVDSDKSKVVLKNDPKWMVSAMVGKDTSFETTVGIKIDRRVLGNIFVGGYLIPTGTKAQAGVSVGYEF